jgi:hypothetical protein
MHDQTVPQEDGNTELDPNERSNFPQEMLTHYTPEDLRRIAQSLDIVGKGLFEKPLSWRDLTMVRREAGPEESLQYVLVVNNPSVHTPGQIEASYIHSPCSASYSPTVNPWGYSVHYSDQSCRSVEGDDILEHLLHLYGISSQERVERYRDMIFTSTA